MANTSRRRWLVPAGLMVLALVPTLFGIVRLLSLAGGISKLDGHERFAADPIPAVLHIVGATSFAMVGAFQFSANSHRNRRHRLIGRVLAPLGIVAALSGMWMTLGGLRGPEDGAALQGMRLGAGTAMVVFIVFALHAVRQRDFLAHGAWMTRAYALGSAAGTQFFTFLPALFLPSLRTVAGNAALMAAGWAINIVVAEIILRRAAQRRSASVREEGRHEDRPAASLVVARTSPN